MQPVKFAEANVVFAKDQDEYNNFPLCRVPDDEHGTLIACWRLSLKERLRVLFTGCIWQSMLTFNQRLQPQNMTTKKADFFIAK